MSAIGALHIWRGYGRDKAAQRDATRLLRQYLATTRIRRDLAEIMGDDDGQLEARDAEADGRLALRMAKAGVW